MSSWNLVVKFLVLGRVRWKTVKKFKPGDYLLCYLTGLSRWIGILEVTSEPYKDDSKIWSIDVFPCQSES